MTSITERVRAEILKAAIPRVISRPSGLSDDFSVKSTPTAEELRDAVTAIFTHGTELDRVNSDQERAEFTEKVFFPVIRKMMRQGWIKETNPTLGVSHYVLTTRGNSVASRLIRSK